ncbi:MAG: metal ABC transporter permease, partial [Acidimicrobiales bacterium]
VDPSTNPLVVVMSALTLVVMFLIFRPLLLSSMSVELAAARGINLRVVGLLFMLALAVAVGLSSLAIGSILSTALLIGPAAASLRVTNNVRHALVLACVLGVGATLLGILFAYDSFYWLPASEGLPVSFFIVAVVFVSYLVSGLRVVRRVVRRSSCAPARAST